MTTRINTNPGLERAIRELLDECDNADDIAHAIQRISFAAKQIVELQRSDFPEVKVGQIWSVPGQSIATVRSNYREFALRKESGKEIVECSSLEKLRYWLYQRNGSLVASSLSQLVETFRPDLTPPVSAKTVTVDESQELSAAIQAS